MVKQDRDNRQRLPRGLQRLLMKAALILQQLAEQPATVLRLVFQEQAEFKPDSGFVFQGHRENQVRAFVLERVFFQFEFCPVKSVQFFFGKNQVKEFQGKVGMRVKLLKEQVMVVVAFLFKGVRFVCGRICHKQPGRLHSGGQLISQQELLSTPVRALKQPLALRRVITMPGSELVQEANGVNHADFPNQRVSHMLIQVQKERKCVCSWENRRRQVKKRNHGTLKPGQQMSFP